MRYAGNLPESLLWKALRGRRFAGFKFRRQHPIGRYIVDFYCAAAQLVIELDGVTHRDRAHIDRDRQEWLEERGLKVLRCHNEELYENFDGLLEAIWYACQTRTPLTPDPSPLEDEGRGEKEENT